MKPKVFITRKIPESGIALLREYCQVRVYPRDRVAPREELVKGVKWCHALLCLLTDSIDRELISAGPTLRVIANYAVGFDNIDIKAATERNIPVTNTPEVLTDAVAEHTFALMMAIARRIPESDRFTRAGKYQGWEPMLLLGTELKGKTLGIIGPGRIGAGVAQRAATGMGMNILYFDVTRNLQFEKMYNAKFAKIDDILTKADFITIHVPLLPTTRHLIGAEQLQMMKPTAYLINTSRGPVIDEKALVKTLKKRGIAGAALDVYEFEPKLSAGLKRLDNVVLTPHTASGTYETRAAMSELAARNILDVLRGKTPQNLVNKEVEDFISKEPLLDSSGLGAET
ncbi:MAG: D-glycerate dehydrogenase [Chloroflexi bacterium]|nr:D-glycerate dehydrogenase [Chloroflexota bacterium]